MNSKTDLSAAEVQQRLSMSLLPAFDEIAQTLLKEPHRKAHTSLQSYLDGTVAVGSAFLTRRAILLAVHDMKEDLEAPLGLQKRTLAELQSLRVFPPPQLRFYRDLATVFLRIEVIVRSRALRALTHGEPKH